jgi:hypothetical protein
LAGEPTRTLSQSFRLRNVMPKIGVSPPPRSDGGAIRGCPSKWSVGSRHNPE